MSQSKYLPSGIRQQIAADFEQEEDQLKAKGVVDFIRSFENDVNKLEYFMKRAKKARVVRDLDPLPKKVGKSVSIHLEDKTGKSTLFPGRASMVLNEMQLSVDAFDKLQRRQQSSLMKSQDYYREYIHKRVMSQQPIDYVRYDENRKEDFQQKVNAYLQKLKKEEEEEKAALETQINERYRKEKQERASRLQSRETNVTPLSVSTGHYLGLKGAMSEEIKQEVTTPIRQRMPWPKTFKLPDINPMTRRLDPSYTPSLQEVNSDADLLGFKQISPAKSSPRAGQVDKVAALPPLELRGSEMMSTPGDLEGNKSRGTGLSTHQNLMSTFASNQQVTIGSSHFLGRKLTIDRESGRFHELFRSICNQKISYKHCKVSRAYLRNYLAKRYDKRVVESMLRGYFEFSHAYTFDEFCNHVDSFLAQDKTSLLRFVFQAFDNNNDGSICEDDIWHVLENVSRDAFEKAFYPDVSLIIEVINQKQADSDYSKILGMDPRRLALFKREATRREMLKSIRDLKKIGLVPERQKGSSISFEEFATIPFPNSGIPCVLDDFLKSISTLSPIAISQQLHSHRTHAEQKSGGYQLSSKDNDEINELRLDYDEDAGQFEAIKKVFLKLAATGQNRVVPKDQKRAFITKEKLKQNMKFGLKIDNKFLAKRLYNLLSEHQADAKIMFPQFLRVLRPMLFGSDQEKHLFAFSLYDRDDDGVINSTDMLKLEKTLPGNCGLMNELKLIIEEYTDKNIWVKDRKKKIQVSEYYFQKLVENSVLTHELRSKLLGRWKKEDVSCFTELEGGRGDEIKRVYPSSLAVRHTSQQNVVGGSARDLESKK